MKTTHALTPEQLLAVVQADDAVDSAELVTVHGQPCVRVFLSVGFWSGSRTEFTAGLERVLSVLENTDFIENA